jgi:hypothetical protein
VDTVMNFLVPLVDGILLITRSSRMEVLHGVIINNVVTVMMTVRSL